MIRSLLRFLAVLFLLAGIAFFFLFGTEGGTGWLLGKALPAVPGLRVERIGGTLLGRLSLQAIDYRSAGMQLTIDRASLRWRPGRLLLGRVVVENLAVEGVRYEQTEAPPPRTAPAGEINLHALRLPIAVIVEEATVAPITLLQPGAEERTIDRIFLAGRADQHGIEIQSLRVSASGFDVALRGSLRPERETPIEAAVEWSVPSETTPLRGKGEIRGDLQYATILHQLIQPVSVRTEGEIQYQNGTAAFDLRGGWSEIQWPPNGPPSIQSGRGAYRLAGRIDDYRFTLDADVGGAALPASDWKLEGTGNQRKVTLERLEAAALNGSVHGQGEFEWTPTIGWKLAVSGAGLNPGVQWAAWPGKIGFDAATEGRLADGVPEGSLRIGRLSGSLRGYPISAKITASARDGGYRLNPLLFRSGSASLRAEGRLVDRWDLRWNLTAPDLSTLYPGAEGRLVAEGEIQGAGARPQIKAHARGGSIAAAGARLKQLRLDLNVDLENRTASFVTLLANDLEGAGQKIKQASLQGRGTAAAHQLRADVDADGRSLTVRMEGGWKENRWEGTLAQSAVRDSIAGRWRLAGPVPMTLGARSAKIEKACWERENAHLCAAGDWEKNGRWQTAGEIAQLPLDLFQPWLPAELSLRGDVDGSWSASGEGERIEGEAALTPRSGALVYQIGQTGETGGKAPTRFPYRDGIFRASLKDRALRAEAALTLVGQGGFRGNLLLSPVFPDWRQGQLEGRLHADLDQLGMVALFTPSLEKPQGKLRADLAVGGKATAPQVKGAILLSEGAVRLPALGIDLRQLQAEIRSRDGGALSLQAAGQSGPGALKVDGEMRLDPEKGWPVRLAIEGDRFESVDLPEAHLLASPHLTIETRGRRVDLGGEILIPEGEIKIKELPKGAVPVSDDVVIVAAPPESKSTIGKGAAWEIHSEVRIRFGEKVAFSGFGLNARLAGHLLATEGPDQATLGEGELQILDGQYRAYGQKLDITKGRLLFAGPIDNPGLDIRAVRKVQEVTAGIHLEGTLKRPQTTVFSDPPMEQSEALAYLLLGHPLNQASRSEGSLLTNAISALGLKGGDLIAKKVGRALGLDEVKIQTDEETHSLESATLVIGRYFSPKFYVSYGIGLFDEKNTLLVRYQINRILTLRAESGDENGIDLLYTKEYNR